jgi:hypothetical protein
MTQNKQLERSYFAIEGVRSNPDRTKALKQAGWTTQETTQGWNLYQKAYGSYTDQKEKMSQQRIATDALRQAEADLDSIYKKHLSLARLAIPYERDIYLSLELTGKRKKERSAWLGQIRNFYDNLGKVAEQLAAYGVTAEEIAQAEAMMDTVTAARVKQNDARGAAQQARIDRDEAYKELNRWMSKFIRAARYAFADTPQQLEALGIIVK